MASAKPAIKFNGSTFGSNLKIDPANNKKEQLKISLKGEKGTVVKFEGTFKSRSGRDILTFGSRSYEKRTGKFSQNEITSAAARTPLSTSPATPPGRAPSA